MNSKFKGIDVVVLFVTDLERSKDFYHDKIGLSVTHQDESSVYFQLESASLLLLAVGGAQDLLSAEVVAVQRPRGATSQLVASVEDVDAVHADLSSRGVEFVREPIDREWGLRTAHFKDPDGNIWEICHPLS